MVIPSKNPNEKQDNTLRNTIFGVVHTIFIVIALYLCFKCNGGFKFFPFILALIFPEFYAIYMIATKGLCQN